MAGAKVSGGSLNSKPGAGRSTGFAIRVRRYAKKIPAAIFRFALATAIAGVAGLRPVGGIDPAHGVGRTAATGEGLEGAHAGDDDSGHARRSPNDRPDTPTADRPGRVDPRALGQSAGHSERSGRAASAFPLRHFASSPDQRDGTGQRSGPGASRQTNWCGNGVPNDSSANPPRRRGAA